MLVLLTFHAAVLLALASVFYSFATFVHEAERGWLFAVCGCGVLTLVLLGLAWARMPPGPRLLALGTAALACVGIANAALRLFVQRLL